MSREIDLIILHTSYTPSSVDIGVAEIRKWHVEERGWLDVGYHFVIRRNGELEEGRPIGRVGAHVRGHNAYSIGICLIGGVAISGTAKLPDCNYTSVQWEALRRLVVDMLNTHPAIAVKGRRDFDPSKSCPVFDAGAWAETLTVKI